MTWWDEHMQTLLRELRAMAAASPEGRAWAWERLKGYEARPEYRGIVAMEKAASKEIEDEQIPQID